MHKLLVILFVIKQCHIFQEYHLSFSCIKQYHIFQEYHISFSYLKQYDIFQEYHLSFSYMKQYHIFQKEYHLLFSYIKQYRIFSRNIIFRLTVYFIFFRKNISLSDNGGNVIFQGSFFLEDHLSFFDQKVVLYLEE